MDICADAELLASIMRRSASDAATTHVTGLAAILAAFITPSVREDARRLPFVKAQLLTSIVTSSGGGAASQITGNGAGAAATTPLSIGTRSPTPGSGFSLSSLVPSSLSRGKEKAALEAALASAPLSETFADAEWDFEDVLRSSVFSGIEAMLADYATTLVWRRDAGV